MGSPSTGERAGGDPHQWVEVRDPAHPHQSLLEQCALQLEMGLCSSEMEMKSKISIIIKTGFRPLLLFRMVTRSGLDSEREREREREMDCEDVGEWIDRLREKIAAFI